VTVRQIARYAAVGLMGVLVLGATVDGFAQSWSGLYSWALEHGLKGWKPQAFPGMVDSFIGIGELAMFLTAIDGHRLRKSLLSWVDLLLPLPVAASGWTASLVCNIGHVNHDFATRATASVPPIASMVRLLLMLRVLHTPTPGRAVTPSARAHGVDGVKGQLVTLDGPGGAGKSTLVRRVADRRDAAGVPVHATTEPSHGPAGRLARANTAIFRGHALACLVAADRYHHLETEIRPALADGKVVICDRYVASSYALQVLDGVEESFVAAINAHAEPPDLAVILTCDPDVLKRRLAIRGSHGRFEDTSELSRAEPDRFAEIATMLAAEGTRTLVLDSTLHHAGFLARRLSAAIQTLRSHTHQ